MMPLYSYGGKINTILFGSSKEFDVLLHHTLAFYWLDDLGLNFTIQITVLIIDIILSFYFVVAIFFSISFLYIIGLAVYQLSGELMDSLNNSWLHLDSVSL
jgi:hypothetical protein